MTDNLKTHAATVRAQFRAGQNIWRRPSVGGLLKRVDELEQQIAAAEQHGWERRGERDAEELREYAGIIKEDWPRDAVLFYMAAVKVKALQYEPESVTQEAPKYCPDCEALTRGRSGPPSYELHTCAEHGILFDAQLDDFPGQTHGKARPQ